MVPGWDAVIRVDGKAVRINFDLFCHADTFRQDMERILSENRARRGRVGQEIILIVSKEESDE